MDLVDKSRKIMLHCTGVDLTLCKQCNHYAHLLDLRSQRLCGSLLKDYITLFAHESWGRQQECCLCYESFFGRAAVLLSWSPWVKKGWERVRNLEVAKMFDPLSSQARQGQSVGLTKGLTVEFITDLANWPILLLFWHFPFWPLHRNTKPGVEKQKNLRVSLQISPLTDFPAYSDTPLTVTVLTGPKCPFIYQKWCGLNDICLEWHFSLVRRVSL